jgi:hypothetical protein
MGVDRTFHHLQRGYGYRCLESEVLILMSITMTPTQELVLEVLIARRRLGEQLWTFSNKSAIVAALKNLENKGLVWMMNGVVSHTIRAGLTEAAVAQYMSKPYFAPESPPQAMRRYTPVVRTPGGGLLTQGFPATLSKAAAVKYAEALLLDPEVTDDVVVAYQDTMPWKELPKEEYES